jgi:hypothetical protein
MIGRLRLAGVVLATVATSSLSGCGSPSIPTVPKDFCELEGRRLSDKEKIVNALIEAYHLYEPDAQAEAMSYRKSVAYSTYTPPEFRVFIRDHRPVSDEKGIREAAARYYEIRPNCCDIFDPWPIRNLKDKKTVERDSFELYYWSDLKPDFSWVNDVEISTFRKIGRRTVQVELGSCGEARLRIGG